MTFKVLAVIVLYNENLEDSLTYRSLLSQRADIDLFVWDNSPCSQRIPEINGRSIIYIHAPENRGLSYAYNKASEYAFVNNYPWMLLLDQDTNFDKDYLSVLEKKIIEYPDVKLFCPVHQLSDGYFLSPVKCYYRFSHISNCKVVGQINLKKYAIINSGLLVDLALFKSVGGYNEKAFLDYSDYQFIERVSKLCRYAVCVNSICIQSFSNDIHDLNKLKKRFKLFCMSLKGCDKSNLLDHIIYFLIVLKRGVSLAIRLRSLSPFRIIFSCYIFNY